MGHLLSQFLYIFLLFQKIFPNTDGLPMLSLYVLICLLFINAALIEYSAILLAIRVKKDKILEETKDKIDFGTMIAYYTGFGMFNLVYVLCAIQK